MSKSLTNLVKISDGKYATECGTFTAERVRAKDNEGRYFTAYELAYNIGAYRSVFTSPYNIGGYENAPRTVAAADAMVEEYAVAAVMGIMGRVKAKADARREAVTA